MNTWPWYSQTCRKEIGEILKEGGSLSAYRANKKVGLGPGEGSQAWKLEREIERKFKVKHAVAVNSGTAALHCALEAVGVRGGEVITSPFTFSATAAAIIMAGARPVFADISETDFCINAENVKRVLTRRTKAILPVHLFGYLPPMQALLELDVPIVEDACQVVGASREGCYSGTFGIAGAYSFNGSKNVPAGEGGCLVTNDDKIAEQARLMANHAENYDMPYVGYNFRMHELVACLARHGLKELDERNTRRRELAEIVGLHKYDGPRAANVYYVYAFLVRRNREAFAKECAKRHLLVSCGYITPHLARYMSFRKYAKGPLPVVTELSERTLCLISTLTPEKELLYGKRVRDTIRKAASAVGGKVLVEGS